MEVPDDAVGGVSLPNCPEPDTALGTHADRYFALSAVPAPPRPAANRRRRALLGVIRVGGVLYHPTVFFTYAVTALVCVVLVGVTSLKFNSVTVFSRKIKSPSISNTKWILFYAANAVRCGGAGGLAASSGRGA